ncbi:phosphoglycerate/bisphosphoglycerate mutase family protein [Heterostelium album PN500]|uniref:Phosphoglycerate/bisphosphoglycerate mutase family protein n=1 Tax=Heterostelium pallidum (strain ATCC 26659 / Pp 5 / PN500) TaxID=670386 RepID=D3AX05_HETP5|nr:phosphoglycerate/bisphosphoglycerate mutase family protein [Heterostelium album PN500]EFA86828.1 phosphoglycerate/bisphosphoglycerate mutase family protein [Heterostelium album PN500]|eukprot:XP_020438931.1 phosphoglycerate/bisphosphoglycerate mutase family protein [Heterostelium album PN500]
MIQQEDNQEVPLIQENGASLKKIYLIRHGQSTFNAAYHANGQKDPYLFDARLTELGEQQANGLAKIVDESLTDIELIVSSPLSRALDTTRRGFSNLISQKNIKTVVIPYHAETVKTSDDNGRPKSMVQKEFLDFDLSHIEERWWYLPTEIKSDFTIDTEEYFKTIGYQEPQESILKRIAIFKEWLLQREENCIAVVGHSDYFYNLFDGKLPNFKNCQVLEWHINTNQTKFLTS